jgi:type VI secretion system protein ImpE
MSAKELLQAGKLAEAIGAQVQAVKAAPGDTTARIFLFELLAAAGDWERASKHLDVVASQAPEMATGVASYQATLRAEQARDALFATGQGAPQRMTAEPLDPEPYLSALVRLRAGDPGEAKRLLTAAEEARPARSATVDGKSCDDFRDADDLLAPFVEVIANGLYGWIPLDQVAKIEFDEPQFLRDLLWRPASIELRNGATAAMLVPVRYAGSATASDDLLRLGRATDWREEGDIAAGIGQRAFFAGEDMVYLLDLREVARPEQQPPAPVSGCLS